MHISNNIFHFTFFHFFSSWNSEISQIYPQFSLQSINRLERMFCQEIKWDLYISSSAYAKYYFALRSLTEKKDFRRDYNVMMINAPNADQVAERSTGIKESFLMSKSLWRELSVYNFKTLMPSAVLTISLPSRAPTLEPNLAMDIFFNSTNSAIKSSAFQSSLFDYDYIYFFFKTILIVGQILSISHDDLK